MFIKGDKMKSINMYSFSLTTNLHHVDNKITQDFKCIDSLLSISNNNVKFNKVNDYRSPVKNISEYIKNCKNSLDGIPEDNYPVIDSSNIDNQFSEILSTIQQSIETLNEKNNLNRTEINSLEKQNNINKLSDFVTESGREKLNVNEDIKLKKEKKRSIKNLFKILISPFKFINRNLLPLRINTVNLNVNQALSEFKLDSISGNNKPVDNLIKRLNELNNTFIKNTNEVINRKNNNKNIDNIIKYQTLERALECKLINDIKILKSEFIADLAKSKFEESYAGLPSEINSKLNLILKEESDDINKNIGMVFSRDTVNELKNLLRDRINTLNENIDTDSIIVKIFDSLMSEKSRADIISKSNGDFKYDKNIISLTLTKELFNQLSQNKDFIGEGNTISKIDNLIRLTNKDISKNIGVATKKIIKSLDKSFYENIKSNERGNELLIRIFKNTSNNINYKWAQDAIVLLISYQTFENQESKISSYTNNGVRDLGGAGVVSTKNTEIENYLKGIFSRIGLDTNNLDGSKDEVLRKYFSNYFEHI